jgi:K+-transporting ATPase KdpF subunit
VRVPASMRFPHAGGSSSLVPGGDLPGRLGTPTQSPFSWSHRERRRVRAADTRDLRAVGPGCEGGGAAVSAANLVGLVISILVVGYLVLALVFPERF